MIRNQEVQMPPALKFTRNGERELVITRRFLASPDLVFLAHTTPALLQRWLGGLPGWTMPVCEFDARLGGKYRYYWQNSDGSGFGLTGTVLEYDRPTVIVTSELFDGQPPEMESINRIVLAAEGSETLMTCTVTYRSAKACDDMVATGMLDGMEISFRQLDTLLESEIVGG
jgi:uncharacterized protein YndB with AHSA1/START domain